MKPIHTIALLGLLGLGSPAPATADDEAKVTLGGVHLCCNACVRAVEDASGAVEGARVECDRTEGTVAIVAPDIETAQKAVDAITDAGYHGTPDSDEVTVKDDSGVTEGKVEALTLSGVHNCCRGCSAAIADALDGVDGIAEVKAEPRSDTVEVSGDFDARAVVEALNEAGFHVKVKKD